MEWHYYILKRLQCGQLVIDHPRGKLWLTCEWGKPIRDHCQEKMETRFFKVNKQDENWIIIITTLIAIIKMIVITTSKK